ncbi:FecR family protein, partial [Opitutales bacterium]|nr:FecR family protein [Opitutales bacterium]
LIFVVSNTAPFTFAQKGSVIVIQTKGVVEAYSPQGRKLTAPVVRGSVLPVGYSIKTRLFAESTLLLSNGTTATLQENSKLRLDKFEQSPFDAKAGSFSQLQAEPSTSKVSIDMETGSLVVQTKKLSKASSFSISTPVGTAVIRGTQFQMAMSPNTGMKLDVAESQVAFTPAGQTQAVVVGPGKGLDASSSGVVKQRPISPSAAQNINLKNSTANSVCGTVPVATAKQANAKATSSSSNDGSEEGSGDSDNEDSSEVEGSESEAAESFIKQASNSQRQVSGQETNPQYLKTVLGLLDPTQSQVDDVPASPGFAPSTRPVSDFEIAIDTKHANSESLDFIPISFLGTAIGTPIELSEDSTREDLYDLLDEWLPDQEFDWLNIPELEEDKNPYLYTASIALEQFLNAPDYSLPVNESFRIAWFLTSLFFHDLTGAHAISGNHILENADWDSIAGGSITPGAVLNAGDLIGYYGSSPYLHSLGTALINEGALGDTNKDVALDILNLFKDQDTNSINIHNSFTLGVLDSSTILNSALLGATHEDLLDALDSPEKQRELAKLFKLYPENLNAVLGADIQIGSASSPTTVNLGQWLQKATIFEGTATTNNNDPSKPSNNKKVFAFAAGKDLHLAGDVTFENSVNGVINKTEDHALVLGSAQETNIGHVEGSGALQPVTTDVTDPNYDPYPTKINFEGSNLGIGSYEDLTLTNVSIDVGGNLALGTLSDMHITQTKISVGRHSDRDNVYMYADELLQANDLTFSGRAREIYMEANTIDLRDVHFPGGSEVMLRSRDGIPNFYGPNTSNKNDSYKPFHVNFYSNSNSYAGQAIIEGEFIQKTHGVDGYNSQNFKTATGDAAIKIRAIPDPK